MGWPTVLIWLTVGIFSSTLLEYLLHRFLGHTWNTPLRARHLRHHDNPDDKQINMVWPAIITALIFVSSMISVSLAYLAIGGALGYLNYERLHRHAHSGYSDWVHLSHHNNPNSNFGVTVPWWDWLFGTSL